ncbi:MAG TPA: tRNA preQ1(34) S-adenosylmethionine ribosyltransferase-isomerase QueA [bacterium]
MHRAPTGIRALSADTPAPLDAYDYPLPDDLIAQVPLAERDQSRMIVLRRGRPGWEHRRFPDLLDLLPPNAVLVVNNTRVMPRRLLGETSRGTPIEALLITEQAAGRWEAMVHRARRVKPGEVVTFAEGQLRAAALDRSADGHWVLQFDDPAALPERLERHGLAPLPPYIVREREAASQHAADKLAYQTVYAQAAGALAAPTAGLHFTPAVIEQLKQRGIPIHAVTLHVGIGTFSPVKVQDPREHVMHAERFEISPQVAEALLAAREAGRPIIAVGTTSVRTLETWARQGFPVGASGETGLFIYPPFEFRAVHGMLTNLHLPKSTLLMLVSAMHTRELLLAAYREAVAQRYRFFSYGDCMLLLP